MSTIKKQFAELVEILEANKDKKVSTILELVYPLVVSQKNETTYIMDENGKPFAIFCWYHKQWELLRSTGDLSSELEVEFGSKANTKTGLSTMCKVGTSKWTKAQRDAKAANAELLTLVANGELEPSKIVEAQLEIEAKRTTMDTTDMPKGITAEKLNKEIDRINKLVSKAK